MGLEGVLRSIEHTGARVSVRYRRGDVEIMVVEVASRASLKDATMWGGPSWHLILEGEAVITQAGRAWEVLAGDALSLPEAAPYTIFNPSRERLRMVSVVVEGGRNAGEEPS